ncbi:hypothetical protein PROFUN_14288 [Planoprotostelium fungivorum]|uniref:Chromo domain-containing protein n=1 Tax=Planoprotostelium fungivorum TaxID=1890364 RepID=A0A2P6N0F0_9EUKA|nr:hypothetical protein PROFUN_14288 [Planoprotostelium fungivorum]
MGEGLKMGQDLLTEDPLKGVKVVIIWWNHCGDIVTGPPDGGQKRNTIAKYLVKWQGYDLDPKNNEDWITDTGHCKDALKDYLRHSKSTQEKTKRRKRTLHH